MLKSAILVATLLLAVPALAHDAAPQPANPPRPVFMVILGNTNLIQFGSLEACQREAKKINSLGRLNWRAVCIEI